MSGETEQSDFAGLVAMATVAALDGCPWVEKGHLWELSSTVAALAAERASEVDSLLLPNETLFEKQELSEKYRYRSNLLSAYAVIAGLQNQVEDDERNMRAARRQIELFMEDGKRERLTVALALLDASVEARNEAWFDFTGQLIEASSLGTPAARAFRESVSDEDVDRIMGRQRADGREANE